MNAEQFTTAALALKARADVATTAEERAAIIAAIHRLVLSTPMAFCLDVQTALFGLVDTLTAGAAGGTGYDETKIRER